MKASIETEIQKTDVPIAYVRGKKNLYSHDFITITNLLAYDSRFLTDVVGTFITTPETDIRIKASNIYITSEFYEDPVTTDIIPLWYTQTMKYPVSSNVVRKRTINISFDSSSENKIAKIERMIENPRQKIDTGSIKFYINSQIQSDNTYYVDYGTGTFYADLSTITENTYLLTITYELVELALDVFVDNGVYDIRVTKHDTDKYIAKLLYSMQTGGIVTYQTEDTTIEETILPVILYHQVSSGIVVPNTYVYALTDRIIFPTNKSYQVFAVRPKNVDSPTILTPREPKGLSVNSPWFMQLEGKGIDSVYISEIPEAKARVEYRKEIVRVVNKNQLLISGRTINTSRNTDEDVSGILLYYPGYKDSPLKIKNYNSLHGLITLNYNVPLETKIVAEYEEIVDWIDYSEMQLNPSLEENASLIQDNFIFVYIDENSNNVDRSIYHILLPKFTTNEIKEYSYEDLVTIMKTKTSNGIPLALINVIEPVDEDYYNIYNTRTKGGYVGSWKYITDVSAWDGEDVDISGIMIAKVPINAQLALEKSLAKWEGVPYDELNSEARKMIISTIDKYKRIGMNIIDIDFEESSI